MQIVISAVINVATSRGPECMIHCTVGRTSWTNTVPRFM